MKVQSNFPVFNKNIQNNYVTQPDNLAVRNFGLQQDTVSFTAFVKPVQVNDAVSVGKKRLIKQFDQILESIPRDMSDEEMEEIIFNRYASFERGLINQLAKLEQRAI